jgi:hypothetical protein
MKHLKLYEDYTDDNGKNVYTTSGADNTNYLMMKLGKMQNFLKEKGIDAKGTYDVVQQIYNKYLKENPDETGAWG